MYTIYFVHVVCIYYIHSVCIYIYTVYIYTVYIQYIYKSLYTTYIYNYTVYVKPILLDSARAQAAAETKEGICKPALILRWFTSNFTGFPI